jgi:hypothetical protein
MLRTKSRRRREMATSDEYCFTWPPYSIIGAAVANSATATGRAQVVNSRSEMK